MGKINSKAKGNRFERQVASLLSEWGGVQMNRTPGSGAFHHMGTDKRFMSDIVPPPGFPFPFSVECKNHEGWSLEQIFSGKGEFSSWWEQCQRDAKTADLLPLLIFTRNRAEIYCCVRYSTFLEIYSISKKFVGRMIIGNGADRIVIGLLSDLLQVDYHALMANENLFGRSQGAAFPSN